MARTIEEQERTTQTAPSNTIIRAQDVNKASANGKSMQGFLQNIGAKQTAPVSTPKRQQSASVSYPNMPANSGNPYASQVYQYGTQIAMFGGNDERMKNYQTAYTNYMQSLTNPYSKYYNPYIQPTNYKAIEGLKQYGYDPAQMSDDQLRMLTVGKRLTDTGYTAAAPTNKSTPEQDLAYWAQEYLQAQDTTLKAEKELDDLGKDIEYYVSKGYSDKQIYDAVSSKYSTLNSMMSKKAEGNAVLLNRAVNFNGDDTIYGMIWSARNGGSVGDYGLDAAAYYSKIGNTYKPDEAYTRRHDATNKDTYNPYADGTTLNLGDKYRVINFSREWLQEHRLELDEDDILKIDDAITNSEKAEAEIARLNEYIAKQLEGKTPQQQVEIYKKLADRMSDDKNDWLKDNEYSTLSQMESKRTSGNPLALGYGVDFNLKDTINDLRARGEAINGEIKTEEAQAEADKRMANARKKYKNDDEGFLKEVESIISDLQKDEKYEGADIETVVTGLQDEVKGIRIKNDRAAKQAETERLAVEKAQQAGSNVLERVQSGEYSMAQMAAMGAKYLRGESIGDGWKAVLGIVDPEYLAGAGDGENSYRDYRESFAGLLTATENAHLYHVQSGPNMVYDANNSYWRNELGDYAYDNLAHVKDAMDDGLITAEQYVEYCLNLQMALDDARAKGIDTKEGMNEYFEQNAVSGGFDPQGLANEIVQSRKVKTEAMAEAEKAGREAMVQALDTAIQNVEAGTATEMDQALYDQYKNTSLDEVFVSNPAVKYEYEKIRTDIEDDTYAYMIRTAKTVVDMNEWIGPERDFDSLVRTNAEQVAAIAMGMYADDAKRAGLYGMTLEEYYQLHPEREKSMVDVRDMAMTKYKDTYAPVWEELESLMMPYEGDVFDLAGSIGNARNAYNEALIAEQKEQHRLEDEAAKAKYEERKSESTNTMNVFEAAYLTGKLAAIDYTQGKVAALSYFITYMGDDELIADNRARFMGDPEKFRAELEKQIDSGIADPELARNYKELLKDYDGDIFNITFNFADQKVQNVLYSLQEKAAYERKHIAETALPILADIIDTSAGVLTNIGQVVESGLLTAVGLPPLMATITAFGVTEGTELGMDLEAAGIPHEVAKCYAAVWAVCTGLMEKNISYDMYIGEAAEAIRYGASLRKSMGVIKKSFGSDSIFAKIGRGLIDFTTKHGTQALGESFQEVTEYVGSALFKSAIEEVYTGDSHIQENWDSAEAFNAGVQALISSPFLSWAGAGFAHTQEWARRITQRNVQNGVTATPAQVQQEAEQAASAELPQFVQTAMGIVEGTREFTQQSLRDLLQQHDAEISNPETMDILLQATSEAEATERVAADLINGALDDIEHGEQARAVADAQAEADKLNDEAQLKLAQMNSVADEMALREDAMKADPANKDKATKYQESLREFTQSKQDYDAAQTQYEAAQAALQEAKNAYGQAKLAAVDNLYQQAQIAVATDRENLTRTIDVAREQRQIAEAAREQMEAAKHAWDVDHSPSNQNDYDTMLAEYVLANQRAEYAELVAEQMKATHVSIGQMGEWVSRKRMLNASIAEMEERVLGTRVKRAGGDVYDIRTMQGLQLMAGAETGSEDYNRGLGLVKLANLGKRVSDAVETYKNLPADATPEQIREAKEAFEAAQREYDAAEQKLLGEESPVEEASQEAQAETPQAETVPNTQTKAVPTKAQKTQPRNTKDTKYYHGQSAVTEAAQAAAEGDAYADVRPAKTTEPAASPVKTIEKLAKQLKVGLYRTKRSNITAHYNEWAQSIVHDSRQAANLAMGMHEIGHHVQNVTKWQLPYDVVKTMRDADIDPLTGDDLAQAQQEEAEEAFAEFFATYMINRESAVRVAGESVVADFEDTLVSHKMDGPIKEASAKISGYLAADTIGKISAQVINESDARTKENERSLTAFMAGAVDYAYAAKGLDDTVRVERREAGLGNTNEAITLMDELHYRTYGNRQAAYCRNEALVNYKGEKIGDSLKTTLAKNGINANNYNEFMWYRLAKHALDRNAAGKGMFSNISDEQLISVVSMYNPIYEQANQAFSNWWQNFTQEWLVNTGIVDQQTMNHWNEIYPNYIPTFRDLSGNRVDAMFTRSNAGKGQNGSWTFKPAGVSDLDIINPYDSIVDLTDSIVQRATDNIIGQAFDRMYTQYEGLGLFAEKISEVKPNTEVQDAAATVGDGQGVDIELMMPSGRDIPGKSSGGKLVVARQDGTVVTYDFSQGDMLLYNALTSHGPEARNAILRVLGGLNRTFSALTTGSNPLFGGRNVVRDIQQAITQGTVATNFATYMPKWFRTFAEVVKSEIFDKHSDIVEEYKAMGGGGWSYSNTAESKGRVQTRSELIEGYRGDTVGEKVKYRAGKLFKVVTLEKLNEALEMTTRLTEYAYGQHDRSTYEGRKKAFLVGQDVTVDFGRYGMSGSYTMMKSIIPFFGPNVQGTAQTAKTLHDAFSANVDDESRSRARKQLAKKFFNVGLAAALQSAIIRLFGDDDDREAYGEVSQDIRTGHLILPGKLFGIKEKPFIRIPLGQSMIDRAIYATGLKIFENVPRGKGLTDRILTATGAMDVQVDDSMDVVSVNLLDAACRILQDASPVDVFQFGSVGTWMNGVMSSSIFAIPYALATNQTYYGENIVSKSLENRYFTEQEYTTTPELFHKMSRALDQATQGELQISPIELQYIAKQYTGFFGQILIPALSTDRASGQWTLANFAYNMKNSLRSSWTIDNLTNNDVSNAFYDYKEQITTLKDWDVDDYIPGICDPNVDPKLMKADAEVLYKEYQNFSKKISACTKTINEINADKTLTPSERAMAVMEPERERLDLMKAFNMRCAEFYNTYGNRNYFERLYMPSK